MELIFLHGAPAVGKRTVAQALAPLIPARVTENHDSIDLALTIMDFGAPGFWDLVYDLRLRVLEAAAQSDLPCLITTACYIHPKDLALYEDWETLIARHGGRIRPIHLHADPDTLRQRIVSADRAKRGKLT